MQSIHSKSIVGLGELMDNVIEDKVWGTLEWFGARNIKHQYCDYGLIGTTKSQFMGLHKKILWLMESKAGERSSNRKSICF